MFDCYSGDPTMQRIRDNLDSDRWAEREARLWDRELEREREARFGEAPPAKSDAGGQEQDTKN